VTAPTNECPPYPLDNDHAYAHAHHRYLGALLDPITRARVTAAVQDTRPTGLTGARCLEVGAGGGSIARWLAGEVGPFGHVTALDLKPHHIPHQQRITIVTHDLNGDEPLPGGPFDLIHARLVLAHLPQRRDILRGLVDRLTLNGVIAIGDWRTTNPDPVIAAPTKADADLYRRYQHLLGTQVFAAAGTDRDWATHTHTALREEGLTDIHTTVDAEFWEGGGTGCQLVATVIEEVRPKLLAAGLTEDELEHLTALVNDPRLVLHGHPLYYTSGRRTPSFKG
jgi:2-polyprenyl-3-methyl-5-hydroxy-6-metoxy-1,4-benzoquinol methylase